MKKTDDKDIMRIISGLGGNYIAEEIIKRSKDKNIIYMTTDIILNTNCVKELANYIEQLQKENEVLKEDMCKLINYIAVRENKTFEDICKEFNV